VFGVSLSAAAVRFLGAVEVEQDCGRLEHDGDLLVVEENDDHLDRRT
jgi:hypothetical protein